MPKNHRSPQSLLASLGKAGNRSPAGYNAPPSSYALHGSYSPSLTSSDESHDTSGYLFGESSRGAGSIHHGVSGRSVSGSTTSSQSGTMYGRQQMPTLTPRNIRRVDDVFMLVRERLIQWSYLMQWYNG